MMPGILRPNSRRPLVAIGWIVIAVLFVVTISALTASANANVGVPAAAHSTASAVSTPAPDPKVPFTNSPPIPGKDSVTGQPVYVSPEQPLVIPATEILGNPGFELGRTVWISTGPYHIIYALPDIPRVHSGNWGAWLGGYHNADDQLFQQVNVPSSATAATLGFWVYSATQELGAGYDYFTLQIIDPATGSHYVDAFAIDAYPATYSWQYKTYTLTSSQLNAIKGKTVRVRFRVVTDFSQLSNFFIDDTSFDVTSGTVPTSTPTSTFTPTTPATDTPTPTAVATATPTPTPTATTAVGIRHLYAPWVGHQPTPVATATPTPTTVPLCPQDPTEPNGTFAEAWGPLPLNQNFLGYFNCLYDTDRDFYFFDLVNQYQVSAKQQSGVVITLENIPAGSDYDLALYNCTNVSCQIGYSGNTGNANERIGVTVDAGRYYVRVTRSANSPLVAQPYRLRVGTP